MSVPGGVAITLGGSKPTSESSRDGAHALDFSGAMLSALSGIGQGPVPADQRQFADLLGNRLKTEDVLQGTLQHMFQKLQEQEVLVGQLHQTVTDLETSHQPWPRSQFEELVGKVGTVNERLETLPPDTALVTKKYLKDYDNQWTKRWTEMEKANAERFDRLETRLASFEEAVLRVELKIEHDMKQCLVELNKALMRLDEVEETGRQAMLQGFERVESDISDLTLRLKEEGERITAGEVAATKTDERLVDAVMDAEETKGRLGRVEERLPQLEAETRSATEALKKELLDDIGTVNDAVIVAQEKADSLQTETDAMKKTLDMLEEGLMDAHGSLSQTTASIQQQQTMIASLQATVTSVQEKATQAAAVAAAAQAGTGRSKFGSAASSRVGTPAREASSTSVPSGGLSAQPSTESIGRPGSTGAGPGDFAFTGEGGAPGGGGGIGAPLALPGAIGLASAPMDGPGIKFAVQSILDKMLPPAIEETMHDKMAELQDVFAKMVDKLANSLAELKGVVDKRGKLLDTTSELGKTTAEAQKEMKADVEMMMGNVVLKEEQDRWRAQIESFSKDLEYFKKKYSRHLGLQVENYTVAGMAKEEDLARLATNVEDKVSRKELQAVLDRAVQRSMDTYTTMQRKQEVDRMVVAGTGHLLQTRCMACDRDMTMLGAAEAPSMASGLLTAGARSHLAPSKSPTGKSKGFLPKIKSSGGPTGPGLNPMEMKRLKQIADQYEGEAAPRPKTSPPTPEAAAAVAVEAQVSEELKEW